jgi:hypothetical protein
MFYDYFNRSSILTNIVLICGLTIAFSQEAQHSHGTQLLIENFTSKLEHGLPTGWQASRKDCSMLTIIQDENERFVRLNTAGECTSFGKQVFFSPDSLPILGWKWRIHKLPEGGCERTRETNDSGAGVYVIFKGKFKFNKIIKYVWSSTLPVGTTIESPFNKNTKIVVLQSGNKKTGKWIAESVNIRVDFISFFAAEPPPVIGIAILSDSDNTSSQAIADYDDFQASELLNNISQK